VPDNGYQKRQASLFDCALPLGFLIFLLALSVYLFGDLSSYGPNQVALLLAMGVAALIGLKNGFSWQEIEDGIVLGVSRALGAMLILLAVGALIGTWMLSGTVPTLIYYGLSILNPDYFYAATCLICGLVAISIGSSWTTAATIGVALMGVSAGLGLSPAISAGAVISGAYFGDKLSPLSETTNLAPAIAGTHLFQHIQYMLWTTVPSIIIALCLFLFLGLQNSTVGGEQNVQQMQAVLNSEFNLGWHLLAPLLMLLLFAVKKMPAFPAISIGALVGGLWAAIFQPELLVKLTGTGQGIDNLMLIWTTLFDGVVFNTSSDTLNSLLSRGGMSSMLNTIWLILCAMTFGAVIEKIGLLDTLVKALLKGAKTAGSIISRVIFTCIGTNILTADQYMAIVMPGRMYKNEFEKRGLNQLNLSRSLEDGGTLTSPLIPWNTCGMYMAGVLAVSPIDYIFYAFFNVINPVFAIIYAYLGIKILRIAIPKHLSAEPPLSQ
jgi:NhaC family Na+:H+ antiporter